MNITYPVKCGWCWTASGKVDASNSASYTANSKAELNTWLSSFWGFYDKVQRVWVADAEGFDWPVQTIREWTSPQKEYNLEPKEVKLNNPKFIGRVSYTYQYNSNAPQNSEENFVVGMTREELMDNAKKLMQEFQSDKSCTYDNFVLNIAPVAESFEIALELAMRPITTAKGAEI